MPEFYLSTAGVLAPEQVRVIPGKAKTPKITRSMGLSGLFWQYGHEIVALAS
jgi:hypothetical protein